MRRRFEFGYKTLFFCLFCVFLSGPSAPAAGDGAARSVEKISAGWEFAEYEDGKAGKWEKVDVPHTWNAHDTIDGDFTYRMGQGLYKKDLEIDLDSDQRYFLRFEGVNEKARVWVNSSEVGSHKGGYTAFAFEITDLVKDGSNHIEVLADNSFDREIMPLYCDFNFYGGVYRDVHLISTGRDLIAVTDHASPGVYVSQKEVSRERADLEFMARVSSDSGDLKLRFSVIDGEGRTLDTAETDLERAGEWLEGVASLSIKSPRLWNGVSDPYLYLARAELVSGGQVVDAVDQPLGLRFFHVDPDQGFFLNGEKYRVKGVNRHQDREGKGNAISREDHEEDFALIREMGANAVRLAHYPQADYAYSICDREGILVWAELPFIGMTGDVTGVFLDSPAFRENLKTQLTELIRQNYNHPSILFWGLFNELSPPGDPYQLIGELNGLAHEEDPYRLTTAATFRKAAFNDVTDLICWNKYFGWYYNRPGKFASWIDEEREEHPDRLLCMSEYGAGGSVKQHSEMDYPVFAFGPWHPENWQARVHERHWEMISEREYLWGSFLWNMFDFSVVSRREGDRPNINDKGMVTFDRKEKKDVFYFYKANWSDEPVVHITDKRFKYRAPFIEVKVYSNLTDLTLEINGKPVEMDSRGYGVYIAKNVWLAPGTNRVVASGKKVDGRIMIDECEW